MTHDGSQLFQLLTDDPRYTIEAYQFVRESLAYAQDSLKLGQEAIEEEVPTGATPKPSPERHLTGQQLCEAVRLYALEEYGYMAKAVLNNWGLVSTGSVGDIVYNLIGIGWMKKSDTDKREHFDDVYDFQIVFQNDFEITPTE